MRGGSEIQLLEPVPPLSPPCDSRSRTVYHGDFFKRTTRALIVHFLVLSFVVVYR